MNVLVGILENRLKNPKEDNSNQLLFAEKL